MGHVRRAAPYGEMYHLPISDQLWLWEEEPFEGMSPRVLTAGYALGILKAQAAKSTSDFVDPEQYDLWLTMEKAPWSYQGAPLLKEVSDE